jgi:hypothetical protein
MSVSFADPAAAALKEPLRILHRIGVVPRAYSLPAIRPELRGVIGPLLIIAKTLIEHDFLDVRGPDPIHNWYFKTSGLPPHVAGAVRATYRWLKHEWIASGAVFLWEGGRGLERNCADDMLAADDGEIERLLPVLRRLVGHRNRVWKLVHGEPVLDPQTGRAEPWKIDGIDRWPRLADYVFALDQTFDRIADVLRRSLIRDYLDGRLSDEQKRPRVIEALQDAHDAGQWPGADRDIKEVARASGFDTSADVVSLHD